MSKQRSRPFRAEKPELIAGQLRAQIVSGALREGEYLGREADLVERFAVSRPSLREALRIVEAEGLVTVLRGHRGGVIVHEPTERHIARAAAIVLAARKVTYENVFQTLTLLESLAAGCLASQRARGRITAKLASVVDAQADCLANPEAFRFTRETFDECLMDSAGNRTLAILARALHEIIAEGSENDTRVKGPVWSPAVRRRWIRSQGRLLELIRAGDRRAAETHWRQQMTVFGRTVLGRNAHTLINFSDRA